MYPAGLYKGGWDNDSLLESTIPFYSLVFVKDGKSISFRGPDPQNHLDGRITLPLIFRPCRIFVTLLLKGRFSSKMA